MIELQKEQYQKFYDKLGEKQFLKVIEEMSELSVEITQYFTKDKIDHTKISEEIGDVFNALESLIYGMGLNEEEIHKNRLEKLLKVNL